MTCELVISGWYASNQPRNYRTKGDDQIRDIGFRPLWWKSLDTFVRPANVLIIDSASPVKPNDAECTTTKFQHVELLINPGHAQNGTTHYCGFMAGVILGLEYALASDVDMVLYVEQDALCYGNDIVKKVKGALRKNDLVFGAGTRVDIQQSFFAANKNGIRHFLSALHAINYCDREVAPEQKFMFAASRFLPRPLIGIVKHTKIDKLRMLGLTLFSMICSLSKNYGVLPFGYGRARPINFTDDVFYFQQGSALEVAEYKKLTGF